VSKDNRKELLEEQKSAATILTYTERYLRKYMEKGDAVIKIIK
jgi:hypothetical protein